MASNKLVVDYFSHLASQEFWKHAPVHTILPRDASGKPGSPYPAGQVPHVVSAINICRAMLTHRPVWKAFETLAVRYSQVRTHSWPKQGPSPLTVDQVTYIFLAKILTTFPIVFVDYGLENPDAKGFHTRRPWDGNFEPGHQQISINGKVSETFVGCHYIGPRAS